MIITQIGGGLGNQMFQYAAARALSLRLGDQDLVLDPGELAHDPLRHYELDAFALPIRFSGRLDQFRQRISFGNPRHPLRRAASLVLPRLQLTVLHDRQTGYDPTFEQVRRSAYLLGNWQSERYFSGIAEIIRKDFTFKDPPDSENQAMLRQIAGCTAVSLHVRRGDYANLPHITARHGLCGLDYYRTAIGKILVAAPEATFFIFSDDPQWTADNLRVDAPAVYVTHNVGKKNREDLRLMTACRHFVIANSTFSWWGAWLSRSPQKVVLAPRRWFAVEHGSEADLLPVDWERIG